MRNCQPNFVPKLSSLSTPMSSRSSAFADQSRPAPKKTPFLRLPRRAEHQRRTATAGPTSAGGTLPSDPTIGVRPS